LRARESSTLGGALKTCIGGSPWRQREGSEILGQRYDSAFQER
jgi:hypothetical protein